MKRIPYGPEEDEIIRRLWPVNHAEAIGPLIGRSAASVSNRAFLLGVHKSPEFIARNSKQFRPGGEPFNKGVPQKEWMPAEARRRTKATRFQPGRPASEARNYRPIGSVRVTRDGTLERKVTDDPSIYPARRWVPVSRLVWEAAHGPVPEGRVVRFKDGMATVKESEITPDRLELVTRAENMHRNGYWQNMPREVAELVQLRGALNRRINSHTRGRSSKAEDRSSNSKRATK